MPLNLAEKKAVVAEITEVANDSVSLVTAEYCGLDVQALTDLRKKARENNVVLRVVRNTLTRKALETTEFKCVSETLVGPLILAFSKEEPSAAARLVRDFAKEHDKLQVKALSVGGQLYDSSHLESVAKLPTKDEAISKLMSVMQAPITKFVRTVQAPVEKLVRTVVAIKDTKS